MTQGLTRKQKESVFLLSLGTFLEYFDLMLYIHMAVLLNDLFFPQTDPTVAKILGAFAFGSTFIFRPIGGFIIGRIGDTIGRKKTVVITTLPWPSAV
jgi:MHS family proline/betaine transporter-like MFS transporter